MTKRCGTEIWSTDLELLHSSRILFPFLFFFFFQKKANHNFFKIKLSYSQHRCWKFKNMSWKIWQIAVKTLQRSRWQLKLLSAKMKRDPNEFLDDKWQDSLIKMVQTYYSLSAWFITWSIHHSIHHPIHFKPDIPKNHHKPAVCRS